MRAILATLREFVLWLSQQDGFRSRIKMADADYFSLSRRDEAIARAAPPRPAPSVRQATRYAVNNPDTKIAEFVAHSQNLGHTDVLTTLRSYGQISRERQKELVTGKSGDE